VEGVLRRISKLAGALVALAVGWMAFVLVAMRTQSPRLLGVVRRFNREVTNKLQRRTAGSTGSTTALIRHRGRTSGRVYETPIGPFIHGDEVLVALPYGAGTDWFRNALAAGGAELLVGGETIVLSEPDVIPVASVGDAFPPGERRTHRIFGVEHCARFRVVEPSRPVNDPGAT
jgi:deazaflavin-dependent oxidoreductase (nitroreductase family)